MEDTHGVASEKVRQLLVDAKIRFTESMPNEKISDIRKMGRKRQ